MIEIDGSQKGGSGTILRLGVAFSAIKNQPLHIYNIRHRRPQPGLKPQHLEAVLTAARLCDAEVEGATINSRELWFNPKQIKGGTIEAEIGTAGSIPMLLMTVLPICLHASNRVELHVSNGGTDVSHSPTINYMRFVLLPILEKMEINAALMPHRYGYYPKGNGEVTMTVEPNTKLRPIRLEKQGRYEKVKGMSVCTFLADRKVAERQAKTAEAYFRSRSLKAEIRILNDTSNPIQKGSSLVLWIETDTGATLGADAIGELGKTSEKVAEEAAQKLWTEISSGSTVDRNMSDMLIPFMGLASGKSAFLTSEISEHLKTNIWVTEEILKVKFETPRSNTLYRVEKLG